MPIGSVLYIWPEDLRLAANEFNRLSRDSQEVLERINSCWWRLDNGWEWYAQANASGQFHQVKRELSVMAAVFTQMSAALLKAANEIEAADKAATHFYSPIDLSSNANSSNLFLNDTTSSTISIDERNQELNKQLQEFVDNREEYPDTVPWPTGFPANQFTDPMQMSEREAKILGNWDLLRFRKMDQLQNEAFSAEEAVYGFDENGENNNNGIPDAFRHSYWSARMTQEFGADWTTDYTNAHEEKAGNMGSMDFMDRHNNAIGIRIAQENPDASPEELARLIVASVENGETIYIPDGSPNGSVAYTNTDPNLFHTPNDNIDIPTASYPHSGATVDDLK